MRGQGGGRLPWVLCCKAEDEMGGLVNAPILLLDTDQGK